MDKTASNSFFPADGAMLFDVRPGVPVHRALDAASAIMESALSILASVADDNNDPRVWGAHTLFETAKAVVDASTSYPSNEGRQ